MFPNSSTVLAPAVRAMPGKGHDDKKERKRMQNRIAQRTYRKRALKVKTDERLALIATSREKPETAAHGPRIRRV